MHRILSALSWKLATAAAIVGMGATGAGATTIIPSLIFNGHSEAPAESTVDDADDGGHRADRETATTTSTTVAIAPTLTADPAADPAEDDTVTTHDHPDNFGAAVSADAHDGGVDGHEISERAHERNAARRAARDDAAAQDQPPLEHPHHRP